MRKPVDPMSRPDILTLCALTFAIVLSFIDRQMINLFTDAIRADVGITDTQISLLQGAAFSASFAIFALPVAYLADRMNRKLIVMVSIAASSLMTVAFGLAQSFGTLGLARAGVAIGEVALFPAAIAFIRDSFPRERQASAAAVLTAGVYLGSGLALGGGGGGVGFLTPVLAGFFSFWNPAPWRLMFMFCGWLGVVGIALTALIKAPPRRLLAQGEGNWRGYGIAFRSQYRRALVYIFGFVCISAMGLALTIWTPTLFIRNHHWTTAYIGLAYGLEFFICGVAGALGSGYFADRLARKGVPDSPVRVARAGGVLAGISGVIVATVTDPHIALIFSGVAIAGIAAMGAVGQLGFQAMFPAVYTARAVATFSLITLALAGSLGPTAVPLLTARLHDGTNIAPSLALVVGFMTALGGASLSLFLKMVPHDIGETAA